MPSLIVNRHGWGITNQLLTIARTELLLLVPQVCVYGKLLHFREGKFLLWQKVIDTLGVVGRDVVHLREILLLLGC